MANISSVNGGEVRTGKMVKKKWQDMASIAKRKEASRVRETMLTGGSLSTAPELTADEVKVVDVLGPIAVEGVASGIDTADAKLVPANGDSNDTGGAVKPPLKKTNGDELLLLQQKRLKIDEELLEVKKKRAEGRKIYLDILEATMKRKNLNREKKEAKKLKVDNVAV